MDLFRKPKKKRDVKQITRAKDDSGSDECASETTEIVRKRRRENPMIQTTKKKTLDVENTSSSSGEDELSDRIAVAEHSFAATGSTGPAGPSDQGATATLEIDTDRAIDAQSQFERIQKQLKEGTEKDGKVLYKGAALYGAREAKDTVKGNAASGMNRFGPMRAPQFLRQSVRWDFAPDVCKDYKETGYCTFGDSCKFVHDRGDYKHGWEIEQDYLEGKYGDDDVDYEIHEEEESYPEDCYICTQPFRDPIVTKCKHYFCEDCAMTAFRKSKRCPICNENTGGIMNIAKDLITYRKKKKQEAEDKQATLKIEEAEENGADDKPCCSHSNSHDHEDVKKEIVAEENLSGVDSEEDGEGDLGDDSDTPKVPDEPLEIEMENVDEIFGGENEDDSCSDNDEK